VRVRQLRARAELGEAGLRSAMVAHQTSAQSFAYEIALCDFGKITDIVQFRKFLS
jgi:hypothetical protein